IALVIVGSILGHLTDRKSIQHNISRLHQNGVVPGVVAEGNAGSVPTNSANMKTGKPSKAPAQKKDNASIAASEKRGGDRPTDKDRKKDVPHPRMQFDDTTRVEKAKKRAVVKQTEVRNRVELFRHLPQYEHGTRLPDLEKKFFRLNSVHPAVYKWAD
ncbi:hypothetical protein Tco_1557686, partial [Tanacetum coccineum]